MRRSTERSQPSVQDFFQLQSSLSSQRASQQPVNSFRSNGDATSDDSDIDEWYSPPRMSGPNFVQMKHAEQHERQERRATVIGRPKPPTPNQLVSHVCDDDDERRCLDVKLVPRNQPRVHRQATRQPPPGGETAAQSEPAEPTISSVLSMER